jgi:hypothetical protein
MDLTMLIQRVCVFAALLNRGFTVVSNTRLRYLTRKYVRQTLTSSFEPSFRPEAISTPATKPCYHSSPKSSLQSPPMNTRRCSTRTLALRHILASQHVNTSGKFHKKQVSSFGQRIIESIHSGTFERSLAYYRMFLKGSPCFS